MVAGNRRSKWDHSIATITTRSNGLENSKDPMQDMSTDTNWFFSMERSHDVPIVAFISWNLMNTGFY
jgi:hypothetical protein